MYTVISHTLVFCMDIMFRNKVIDLIYILLRFVLELT